MLLKNAVPEVLDYTKQHQTGRGTKKVPNETFTVTEGWFRDSGIYDLSPLDKLTCSGGYT